MKYPLFPNTNDLPQIRNWAGYSDDSESRAHYPGSETDWGTGTTEPQMPQWDGQGYHESKQGSHQTSFEMEQKCLQVNVSFLAIFTLFFLRLTECYEAPIGIGHIQIEGGLLAHPSSLQHN